ncbi:MAG: (4Fe-4S)-binding protein, partial [Candidatus Marinimicrobia bacterium]|nr:(4Fe-4S)-binding protein [Candidatus Neomarinimicrobiota bacterium]
GYCARICPENAITNIDNNVGQWIESNIKTGTKMVHAKMKVGAENSGKLVAKVKREAKRIAEEENIQLVLVDGSPGVGCPVVSSLSGANYVILVTEPSVSGLHDLIRVYELVEKFKIKAGCIINKADINKEKAGDILKFLKEKNIDHIANLPYDEMFTAAMTAGKTIVEFGDSEIKEILEKSWNKILKI